jgi:FkbM family methyltransferase
MDAVGAFIRISRRFNPSLSAWAFWNHRRCRDNVALRIVEHLVHQGDVVVDIGACWGNYAWQLGRLVGPSGHVHVVEPNPAMAPFLRSIGRTRANMTLHQVALSDGADETQLQIPVIGGRTVSELASIGMPPARASVAHTRLTARTETLDAILPARGARVTFIKCDVEGHELAVLRGAEGTLRRSQPALLVEIEQRHLIDGANVSDTFEHLLACGYVGYAVDHTGLRPLDDFDLQRDQLAFLGPEFNLFEMPSAYVNNFLFVPPGTEVDDLRRPAASRLGEALNWS